MLEIFEFQPQLPAAPITWNRVGLTHISFNVTNLRKWHDYLVSKGVPANRITTEGLGDTKPKNKKVKKENRRVELVVLTGK